MSLNKVLLIGRLGKDPETRYFQDGTAVVNMSLATDEGYTDRNGNKVDKTEWHRIVAFGKQAEICSQYLQKGSKIFVEGKLRTRKWQDQDGQDRYITEIVIFRVLFLDNRRQQSQTETADDMEDYGPAYDSSPIDDAPF
jgi:single-strand DNA-binding protein